MKLFVTIIFSFLILNSAFAQKLPFQNFSVDKGLIQSQVQCFTQDKQRHLWIGTFGGLDRFDGTSFKHFTKNDGLISSGISCLYTAKNGTIWVGTFKGIISYNGFTITNHAIEDNSTNYNFSTITEDTKGNIWAFNFNKGLFIFQNNQFKKATLPIPGAFPTCLYKNIEGQIVVNFHKKGIYTFKQNVWGKISDASFLNEGEFIMTIIDDNKSYYALTNKKLLVKFLNNTIEARQNINVGNLGGLCFDKRGDIWVGTNKGVIVINSNNLITSVRYTAAMGLSDNFIGTIYRDAEGNMWIGTDGDGIFKFSGGAFSKYDITNGLPGNIIMGIVHDESKGLYLGAREGGLVKYNFSTKKIIPIDYSSQSKAGINSMASDNKGTLFIGTMDNKLLKFNGNTFKRVVLDSRVNTFVNSISIDNSSIWIAASSGCYNLTGDSVRKIKGIDDVTLSVLPLEKDKIIIGSNNGIYTAIKNDSAKKVSNSILKNTEANCLVLYKKYVLIGTFGDGLYFWEPQLDNVYKCDSKNGMADNHVFSIFIDSKGVIWAGSGTGIQQVMFNESKKSFSVKRFSKSDGYESSENNLNTIAEDNEGNVWIGTTKGAFVYTDKFSQQANARPYIVIQRVSSSQTDQNPEGHKKVTPWYNLPVLPILPYKNNNISFTVKGIFLKDPEDLLYSYQLVGYDSGFSQPVRQTFFNYQSLEPGNYVFRIKAITPEGVASENIEEYPFSIATPFYKTTWFLIIVICALILTGVLIQMLANKAKKKKEELLEQIKNEEQEKVRQRTSEDFHDELGNKLTRISLLADILQKNVGEADTEKSNLIQQIKENVSGLYTGTKDVIWSLSANSDDFLEIVKRIEQFGNELFHDAEIDFSVHGVAQIEGGIKLPVDYSRNIIMIFKELMNNCLRHAKASKLILKFEVTGNNEIIISQEDNGTGFNEKTTIRGNGLNNVQRRAERIGAEISLFTKENEGTLVSLKLKIPQKGG